MFIKNRSDLAAHQTFFSGQSAQLELSRNVFFKSGKQNPCPGKLGEFHAASVVEHGDLASRYTPSFSPQNI